MAADFLTGSLEENVLTVLCYDTSNAPALATRITPDLFSTRAYRDIAKVAINHLERFSVPPGAHLRDMFEDKLRKGTDDGKLLKQTFDAMETLAPDVQADYVLAELEEFIASRQLSNALDSAMELLAKGKLKEAQDAVHTVGPDRVGAGQGIWLHKPEQALSFLDKAQDDLMSSGVSMLDKHHCGPRRKGLFLWLAPPNRGKTWALINMGAANIARGKNVLHVSLEMEEEWIAQRYVQNLFALTDKEPETLRTPIFNLDDLGRCVEINFAEHDYVALQNERRAEYADKLTHMRNRGRLLVKSFPSGSLSVPQLSAYLQWIIKREGFKPDLVLLDYWDLMKMDAKNLRIETGRLGVELRGLAQVMDFALATATQTGRAGAVSGHTREQHISEDYSKMMTSDDVVTYSQTEAEERLGLARLWVEKARQARKHYMVLISQSYATGQFALDSALMDSRLREQVKTMTGGDKD